MKSIKVKAHKRNGKTVKAHTRRGNDFAMAHPVSGKYMTVSRVSPAHERLMALGVKSYGRARDLDRYEKMKAKLLKSGKITKEQAYQADVATYG